MVLNQKYFEFITSVANNGGRSWAKETGCSLYASSICQPIIFDEDPRRTNVQQNLQNEHMDRSSLNRVAPKVFTG